MIVADVFHIKNRGPVVTVTIDHDAPPKAGRDALRRTSDGVTWRITGVEWPVIHKMIGILLPRDADVKAGDVVEIVPQTQNSPPPR